MVIFLQIPLSASPQQREKVGLIKVRSPTPFNLGLFHFSAGAYKKGYMMIWVDVIC